MITDRCLATVRIAATLTHMFASLATRLSDEERLVAEVAWPPSRCPGANAMAVHPCGFRTAATTAWQQHCAGRPLRFLDLDHDPVVEMVAVAGGRVWPSGIVRAPVIGGYVYGFGSTLEIGACRRVGRGLIAAFEPPAAVRRVGIRDDTGTGITVTFAELGADPSGDEESRLIDLHERLMARYAATGMIESLGTGAAHR